MIEAIEKYNKIFSQHNELNDLIPLLNEKEQLLYFVQRASKGVFSWTYRASDNSFYFIKENKIKAFNKKHGTTTINNDLFLLLGVVELGFENKAKVKPDIINGIKNKMYRKLAHSLNEEIGFLYDLEKLEEQGVEVIQL